MNYIIDAHTLNVRRYYIDTINFERYDFTRASNYLIDPSELPVCDCTAGSENPCGADSNCLNRMLQFECNPQTCPSKENCHSVGTTQLEQHTHRFLWRDIVTRKEPDTYVIQRVSFGDRPSGFECFASCNR